MATHRAAAALVLNGGDDALLTPVESIGNLDALGDKGGGERARGGRGVESAAVQALERLPLGLGLVACSASTERTQERGGVSIIISSNAHRGTVFDV